MTLNSRLQTYQILTNDDQMLILCLSYFINTVIRIKNLLPWNQSVGIFLHYFLAGASNSTTVIMLGT